MSAISTRIAVAGGGVGGLAAGIALRAAGFAVTVFERGALPGAAGGGLVLAPNGMHALDALGSRLGDAVRAAGHVAEPGQSRPWLSSSGTTVSDDPIGEFGLTYGAPQVSLLRRALLGTLLAEAATVGVGIRADAAVTGFADTADSVVVQLADGDVIEADLLVATDGIASPIRRALLDDGPPDYCGYTSVRGQARAPGGYPYGFVVSGRGLQIFVAPVGGARVYWTAKITARPREWPAMTAEAAVAGLRRMTDGWRGPVAELLASDLDGVPVIVTDVASRRPPTVLHRGRVVMLGDAAHPVPPALSQGASIAIEDAVVLARCLADGTNVTDALADFAARRIPRLRTVVLRSLARGQVDQGSSRLKSLGRMVAQRTGRLATTNAGYAEVYGWRP